MDYKYPLPGSLSAPLDTKKTEEEEEEEEARAPNVNGAYHMRRMQDRYPFAPRTLTFPNYRAFKTQYSKFRGLSEATQNRIVEVLEQSDVQESVVFSRTRQQKRPPPETTWLSYHQCQFVAECWMNWMYGYHSNRNSNKKEIETIIRTNSSVSIVGDGAVLMATAMTEEGFGSIEWSLPFAESITDVHQIAAHLTALQGRIEGSIVQPEWRRKAVIEKTKDQLIALIVEYTESIIQSLTRATRSGLDHVPLSEKEKESGKAAEAADVKQNQLHHNVTSVHELTRKCGALLNLLDEEKETKNETEEFRMNILRLRSFYYSIMRRVDRPRYIPAPPEASALSFKGLLRGTEQIRGRMDLSGFASILESQRKTTTTTTKEDNVKVNIMEMDWNVYPSEWLQFLCHIRFAAERCTNDITWFMWWEPQEIWSDDKQTIRAGRRFMNNPKTFAQNTLVMLRRWNTKTKDGQPRKYQGQTLYGATIDYPTYRMLELISSTPIKEDLRSVAVSEWIPRTLMSGMDFQSGKTEASLAFSSDVGLTTIAHPQLRPLNGSLVDPFFSETAGPSSANERTRFFYLNSIASEGKRFWFYASCRDTIRVKEAQKLFVSKVWMTHEEGRRFQPLALSASPSGMGWLKMFDFVSPLHPSNAPLFTNIPLTVARTETQVRTIGIEILERVFELEEWNQPSGPGHQNITVPLGGVLKKSANIELKISRGHWSLPPDPQTGKAYYFSQRIRFIQTTSKKHTLWIDLHITSEMELVQLLAVAFVRLFDAASTGQNILVYDDATGQYTERPLVTSLLDANQRPVILAQKNTALADLYRSVSVDLLRILLSVYVYFMDHRFSVPYKSRWTNVGIASDTQRQQYADRTQHNRQKYLLPAMQKAETVWNAFTDKKFNETATPAVLSQMLSDMVPFCQFVDSGFTDFQLEEKKQATAATTVSSSGNYDGGRVFPFMKRVSDHPNEISDWAAFQFHFIKVQARGFPGWFRYNDNLFDVSFETWANNLIQSIDHLAATTTLSMFMTQIHDKLNRKQKNNNNNNQNPDPWLAALDHWLLRMAATVIYRHLILTVSERRNYNPISSYINQISSEISYRRIREVVSTGRRICEYGHKYLLGALNPDEDEHKFHVLELGGGYSGLSAHSLETMKPHPCVVHVFGSEIKEAWSEPLAREVRPLIYLSAKEEKHWPLQQRIQMEFIHVSFLNNEQIQTGVTYAMNRCFNYLSITKATRENQNALCVAFVVPGRRTDLTFQHPSKDWTRVITETTYNPETQKREPFETDLTHWIKEGMKENQKEWDEILKSSSLSASNQLNDDDGDFVADRPFRLIVVPMGMVTAVYCFLYYNINDYKFQEFVMQSLPVQYRKGIFQTGRNMAAFADKKFKKQTSNKQQRQRQSFQVIRVSSVPQPQPSLVPISEIEQKVLLRNQQARKIPAIESSKRKRLLKENGGKLILPSGNFSRSRDRCGRFKSSHHHHK